MSLVVGCARSDPEEYCELAAVRTNPAAMLGLYWNPETSAIFFEVLDCPEFVDPEELQDISGITRDELLIRAHRRLATPGAVGCAATLEFAEDFAKIYTGARELSQAYGPVIVQRKMCKLFPECTKWERISESFATDYHLCMLTVGICRSPNVDRASFVSELRHELEAFSGL